MSPLSLRQLLEVGAHVGHKKERSHPAARRFVYTVKDGVLVINVEKTVEALSQAIDFLRKVMAEGGTILFVGTKPQAKAAVKATAQALGMPYVVRRWLGGTLTNFETVKKSLLQLEELEKRLNNPSFEQLPKRERTHLKEKQAKLTETFEGILTMNKLPQALFVVDPFFEDIAVAEARRLGIPVAAILDTSANPNVIDYPVPANDDSKRAIELILGVVTEELKTAKASTAREEKEKEPGGERAKKPAAKAQPTPKATKPPKRKETATKAKTAKKGKK